MEHLAQSPSVVQSDEDAHAYADLESSTLKSMLARARTLSEAERGPFVTRVTVRLRSLGAAPPEERQVAAQAVLSLLDEAAFDDLVDGSGTSAHGAAVEAVLSLGYPHALGLRPEDLMRFRGVDAPPTLPRRGWQLPLAAVLVGVGMQGGSFLTASSDGVLSTLQRLGPLGVAGAAAYGLLALSAGAALIVRPQSRWHRWTRWAVLATGVAFGTLLGVTIGQLPADAWLHTFKLLAWDEALVAAAVVAGLWPRTRPL